jgi:uncharacterized protein (DUF58 family)
MWPTKRALLVALAGVPLALPAALLPQLVWPWCVLWLAALLAFAADAAWLPRRRDLTASWDVPGAVPVGATAEARFTLVFARAARLATVKCDCAGELAPLAEQEVACADGRGACTLALAPRRRGFARVETLWVRFAGPLGLLERVCAIPVGKDVTVTVNFPAVRRTAIECLRTQQFRAGPRIEHFLGEGTEFDALREYARGMDARRIDWKASARHRAMLVKHYRAERNQQVVLAIDTGRLMGEPLAGLPRLDHAIEAALLLAYVSLRSGDQVGAVAFDQEIGALARPQKGLRTLHGLIELFSRLSYTAVETNFTHCLTELAARLPRRTLLVVLTDFVDSITAELMVENLARLGERHLALFVGLRDPELEAIAASPPADALALNRAVLAGTLLEERELVFRRLRRQGVQCVDAPPGALGLELVRRYVDIKRRERI